MKKLMLLLIILSQSAWLALAGGKNYTGIDGSKIRGFSCYSSLTNADLDSVKKWGGNTLRVMLMIGDLHQMSGQDTGRTSRVDPEKLHKLKEFVDRCLKRDLMVIIDYHETPGLVRWSGYKDFRLWRVDKVGRRFQDIVVETWKTLTVTFATYPENAIVYELFNEPEPKANDVDAPENQGYVWDKLQSRLIREIRKIDQQHTIIAAPPYGWRVSAISPSGYTLAGKGWKTNFPGWKPAKEILKDGKVMLTVHMYHPHDFTLQINAWFGKGQIKGYPGKFSGDIWPEAQWDKNRLRWAMNPVVDFQKKYPNVPVVITEFSAVRIAPGSAQYLEDIISIFKDLKLGWTYHAYKEGEHYGPGSDLMFELEPLEIPKSGRKSPSVDPYDRFKVVINGFKN